MIIQYRTKLIHCRDINAKDSETGSTTEGQIRSKIKNKINSPRQLQRPTKRFKEIFFYTIEENDEEHSEAKKNVLFEG